MGSYGQSLSSAAQNGQPIPIQEHEEAFDRIPDLPSLARTVCEGQGVDERELCSGSRKREVVKSRRIFCQIAVRKMGYSGAEVARFFGINTSAVNRLAVSDELPDVEKYA